MDDTTYIAHETGVMKMWDETDLYGKIMSNTNNGEIFRFCDGPPFVSANTLHFGHLLVAYIKDVILRHHYKRGEKCLNKLGFDCHGLPVEMIAYKLLNISSNKEVHAMGIDKFNAFCKKTVNEFAGAWYPIYDRVGRLVDKKNTYKTMDTKFMESTWWVFNELWKKSLVLREYEVMPFSTKCSTPLSNFEAGSSNKNIKTESIFVLFPIKNSDLNIVAWTTTPWTLPSNVALCVNPNAMYVILTDAKGVKYVVAEKCVAECKIKFTKQEPYKLGKDIVGTEYIPPYNYLNRAIYKIVADDFVLVEPKENKDDKSEEVDQNDDQNEKSQVQDAEKHSKFVGTGIVHIAPAFGVDDMNVCITNNIVTMDDIEHCCPVDNEGKYTSTVSDYEAQHVFEANDKIILELKNRGIVLRSYNYTHSYPHCPRTDTPLIYKAVKSFFIDVPKIKDQLVANNKKVTWVPEYVGSRRFHSWISNVKKWGISRQRYFGTPIPVWISDDGEEMQCFGSIKDLLDAAGLSHMTLDDIHPEFIDSILIPSKKGKGYLKRDNCVMDCWFESGCVPMAQYHYPFENKLSVDDRIGEGYLTDFIAEGLDQTRGWFYTLFVLSVALFDKPPAKTIVTTGLILDENGLKFSKRYGNFKDPMPVLDEHGADVMRLYLLSSPAVRAEPLKFTEKNIHMLKQRLIPYINVVKFYNEHKTNFEKSGNKFDDSHKTNEYDGYNVSDQWILSRIGSLINDVHDKLDTYQIDAGVKLSLDFIDDLANWYVKFNRDRLKGMVDVDQWRMSLTVLHKVLMSYCNMMSPFTPYLSEYLYGILNGNDNTVSRSSIHLIAYPSVDSFVKQENTEIKFRRLQNVIIKIRKLRDMSNGFTSLKTPIKKVTFISHDESYMSDVKEFEELVQDECNCLSFDYRSQNEFTSYKIIPNHKSMGIKFKTMANALKKELDKITYFDPTMKEIVIELNNTSYELVKDKDFELVPIMKFDENQKNVLTTGTENDDITIQIDTTIDEETTNMFLVRNFIAHVQSMRKDLHLRPWNSIKLYMVVPNDHDVKKFEMQTILRKYNNKIYERLKCNLEIVSSVSEVDTIKSCKKPFENCEVYIYINDPVFLSKINSC